MSKPLSVCAPRQLSRCPICGGTQFVQVRVLWPELIAAWELSDTEAASIDRQQGYCCVDCGGNLRSMALAEAVVRSYGYQGTLDEFSRSPSAANLKILEINPAGTLTKYLDAMPKHRLITYPEHDMIKLDIANGSFDLVVHSDTLEHVEHPEAGLAECLRVLGKDGRCIFTIPIIAGRLCRTRQGLPNSYHGCSDDVAPDLLVQTEFGADFWTTVLVAGFRSCNVHCLDYPAGLAIEARN